MSGTPNRGRQARPDAAGFSLIELLVSVAVIAVLVAIAVPNYGGSTKAANEAAAISNLRVMSSAQALYHNRYGRYASNYEQLVSTGFLSVAAQSTGYALSVSGDGAGWYAVAQPQQPGITGDRYFYIGDDGVIRWAIGAPPTSSAPALGSGDDSSSLIEDPE